MRAVLAAALPLVALLGLLSAVPAAAAPVQSGLPKPPVVLAVVPDRIGAHEAESERYGDWQSFLGDFTATGAVRVEVLTCGAFRRAVAAPPLASGFATLFVRADGRALVQSGMVLDPDVYRVGAEWLRGAATLAEARRWGLAPVALVPRDRR